MSVSRYLLAATLGATIVLPSTAEAAAPCGGYISPYSINVPGYADCMVDYTAGRVAYIAGCTAAYDPLSPPFGQQVVPQTVAYANCVA